MSCRHGTTSLKAHDNTYSTKTSVVVERKSLRGTVLAREHSATVANHRRDLNAVRHHYKRPHAEWAAKWSLRRTMKLHETGDSRDWSRQRPTPAAENNRSTTERPSNFATLSSSSGRFLTTTKDSLTQRRQRATSRDALQPATRATSVRGPSEHWGSSGAVVATEPNADGTVRERSATSGSSRMSISSSDSQSQAPSTTARAIKRPRPPPVRHQERLNDSSDKMATPVENSRRKSPSAHGPFLPLRTVDKTAIGIMELRPIVTTNDKESLTAARPMDRHERVERYLKSSDVVPRQLPTINKNGELQRRRHRTHSSRISDSVDDRLHRAAISRLATHPAKLRRSNRTQFDSGDKFDDVKKDDRRKQQRCSHSHRSAKTRRSSADRVKYSFPLFNESVSAEGKRKRRGRRRCEWNSSGSSSTDDSTSETATPPRRAFRRGAEAARRRRRREVPSRSSTDDSSSSGGHDGGQTAIRNALIDSLTLAARKHAVSRSIERNAAASAASRCSPNDVDGRRRHRQPQSKHNENDVELSISETDKDLWRKYFADLYTFNMLQRTNLAKKRRETQTREDNVDANNDDDDGFERQHTLRVSPEALTDDTKARPVCSGISLVKSHLTRNFDASRGVNGPTSSAMPADPSSAAQDGDVAATSSSRPGVVVAKPSVTSTVDESSDRATPQSPSSVPVPLFSLNLSGVLSSVSQSHAISSLSSYLLIDGDVA